MTVIYDVTQERDLQYKIDRVAADLIICAIVGVIYQAAALALFFTERWPLGAVYQFVATAMTFVIFKNCFRLSLFNEQMDTLLENRRPLGMKDD